MILIIIGVTGIENVCLDVQLDKILKTFGFADRYHIPLNW